MTWPELEYERSRDTIQTLQRYVQIVGKIKLEKTPWVNHSWGSALYVTEAGMSTSVIHDRGFSFSIEFDFRKHELRIQKSDASEVLLPLASEAVALFHGKCMGALSEMGIQAHIYDRPNELPDARPFSQDMEHCLYDPDYASRFWHVLLQCDRVMKVFRSRFSGKASPVHFFWGSFDLALSLFSGRRAPEHPGGFAHLPDLVTREAYSHEECSFGFWPGNDLFREPAFYSYAYPNPDGFENTPMPEGAYFHPGMKEFILPYEVVRKAGAPDDLILEFFRSSFGAAENLGAWDSAALEASPYLRILQSRQAGHLRNVA